MESIDALPFTVHTSPVVDDVKVVSPADASRVGSKSAARVPSIPSYSCAVYMSPDNGNSEPESLPAPSVNNAAES